jgi:hypothetical protein
MIIDQSVDEKKQMINASSFVVELENESQRRRNELNKKYFDFLDAIMFDLFNQISR